MGQTSDWNFQTSDPGPSAKGLVARTLGAGQSFINISVNATTTVKVGGGFLHSLVINGLGLASLATLIDGTTTSSGKVIASINTTLSLTPLRYDIAFDAGLLVVTSGTTAADLTLSYR